jgi:hypothetical protein
LSKRTFGILAGVVGSAIGTWWLARHRAAQNRARYATPAREHGTVIFRNTPTAGENAPL